MFEVSVEETFARGMRCGTIAANARTFTGTIGA